MKTYLKIASIIIGIALIINAVVLALVTNFNFGIIITLLVGISLLVLGIYFDKLNLLMKNGILKWVKYAIISLAAFMVCVITFIAICGQYDTVTYSEDALIVLGAGIRGETVTLPLMYRLDKAVEYINKNQNAIIVVSGGQGAQENITEALAMEKYLTSRGVPKDKIIREEKATSTFENFEYSKQILDKYFKKPYKIAFITNNFHIYRASRLAKIVGFDSTQCHAKLEWYTIPINYLREFTAVLKLWVLRR